MRFRHITLIGDHFGPVYQDSDEDRIYFINMQHAWQHIYPWDEAAIDAEMEREWHDG